MTICQLRFCHFAFL